MSDTFVRRLDWVETPEGRVGLVYSTSRYMNEATVQLGPDGPFKSYKLWNLKPASDHQIAVVTGQRIDDRGLGNMIPREAPKDGK